MSGRTGRAALLATLLAGAIVLVSGGAHDAQARPVVGRRVPAAAPLIATIYPVDKPIGLMVTTGGWAYCEQARPIARTAGYTLLCGAYDRDGYLGPGLRSLRQLDWGNPRYLASFASTIVRTRRQVRGPLVLVGASYAGFGVATLAAHHPELRPQRLVVIDSYLDLVARRGALPDAHETALEIDREVGQAPNALRRRSAGAAGLERLVRTGTRLTVIWSVSEHERQFFRGATCNRTASAETLARLADRLGRPVTAWVTRTRHGVNLWRRGVAIVRGRNFGRLVRFVPGHAIPPVAVCEP